MINGIAIITTKEAMIVPTGEDISSPEELHQLDSVELTESESSNSVEKETFLVG